MIRDVDGLVSLVQLGALEIHPWGAHADRLERPDRIVLDLDPGPGIVWKQVVEAARGLRAVLEDRGLRSFVKTTGGKGLHRVLPIERRTTWDELKEFARGIADGLVRAEPRLFIATASKARRTKRIFIDWLRNARGATAIAPYSTRARAGAPVAAPLDWDELRAVPSADAFDVRAMRERVAGPDPWADFFKVRQSLGKERRPS
jgi:bifunctional non-homologous end joining protein LigD